MPHYPPLTKEQYVNYVLCPFSSRKDAKKGQVMVRAVAEEALALASISLFLATVAVWVQVFGVL